MTLLGSGRQWRVLSFLVSKNSLKAWLYGARLSYYWYTFIFIFGKIKSARTMIFTLLFSRRNQKATHKLILEAFFTIILLNYDNIDNVSISKFNGTSTPKGSYRAKTDDNDCKVNSSRYSLSTALCESIRYQAKSEQNVRQDLIPRVRHGEAALCTPIMY